MPRSNVGKPFSLTIDPNNAISLDGSTQFGTVSPFAAMSAMTNFTLEFWFYEDSTETVAQMAALRNGGTGYAAFGNDNGNNDLNNSVEYATENAFNGNSGAIFTTNAFHHFAVVSDAVARFLSNYIDGALVGSAFSRVGTGALVGFPNASLSIGGVSGGFKGKFACIRLWNVKRSAAEILANKDYYLDPSQETGLIGNWNFNQGSGTSVPNTVSAGTGDMALTASPSWAAGPTLITKPYNGPRVAAGARTLAGARTTITL